MKVDIAIIGGGPAGLAAAIKAYDSGCKNIVIIERDNQLGGILQQCIHNGFGLTRFKENLTGPEYAQKFIDLLKQRTISVLTETIVLQLQQDKTLKCMNEKQGIFFISALAVVLAMGCRERSKGSLNIAGERPSGLFSAGTAQKYVNMMGKLPGKRVVILGSGDIGLIMARRLTLEGAKVLAVIEIMPHPGGLRRNIAQCLDDYGIPLLLSHTITYIHGKGRVSGVTVAQVDSSRMPICGTQQFFDCDTVLFSVGLLPENELTAAANIPISALTKGAIVDERRSTEHDGVFACGNVLHVHDLVDFVSEEAEIAGEQAAQYVLGKRTTPDYMYTAPGNGVSYVLPQKISKQPGASVKLFFRVKAAKINAQIIVQSGDEVLLRQKRIAVAPGEMESVRLSEKQLSLVTKPIIIEVE